ncbi:NUDIX hydrolase [Microbacterium sp. C7(2022)]|uniref:NUDIX domain-containing protein n=1 Tax=Microbacterium sp. C7(2022) TaxID=2992759 RepID=UPI00237ACB75|nr:NUDIX hydrolase [Microbacterium sp. C7(2022)]MDE0546669.1 NUDIX hydrolase [Microbacterium sp. C7(2022)]
MTEARVSQGLLTDDPVSAEVARSETVYEGRVWNIRRDEVTYNGDTIVREYMDHTGAVAVLALDDEDRVLLIKQYRHPVRVRDWEIPAGLLDIAGENPLDSARRELAEEADLVADRWNVLAEFYTTPGGSDEAIRIYLARGLSPASETFAREDEEADIEVKWVPLDEVVEAILARRVQNPSLVVGVLAAHASRRDGWVSLGAPDESWERRTRPVGVGTE